MKPYIIPEWTFRHHHWEFSKGSNKYRYQIETNEHGEHSISLFRQREQKRDFIWNIQYNYNNREKRRVFQQRINGDVVTVKENKNNLSIIIL